MMMMNKLNWNTTNCDDDRVLYLTVMRDLKKYCARGYCEIEITLYHFVALPQSYIKRTLPTLASAKIVRHFIIDWSDYTSVHRFLRMMIAIICDLNDANFNSLAFNAAIDEFAQYLIKKRKPEVYDPP